MHTLPQLARLSLVVELWNSLLLAIFLLLQELATPLQLLSQGVLVQEVMALRLTGFYGLLEGTENATLRAAASAMRGSSVCSRCVLGCSSMHFFFLRKNCFSENCLGSLVVRGPLAPLTESNVPQSSQNISQYISTYLHYQYSV